MEDGKRMKILLLEDNEDDVKLIERILIKGDISFISKQVDTRDSFCDAISSFQPDVILSDHSLPGFNSREALRITITTKSTVPFILVTGMVSDEYAISCLREGADDYILKSNLARLPVAIRAAIKKRTLVRLKRDARLSLRIQNEQLTKVNKELDNFVYSVSHNLRGPLASVMGLLNVAKGVNKNIEVTHLHEMMSSSILKLDFTLREILDYSRNSRNEVQLSDIDWKPMIDSAFEKLNYLMHSNEIIKVIKLQADAPFFCDESRLLVILNNLLSNSIQYRNRYINLVIEIEVETSAAGVIVTIKDNGIGIAEKVLPKVFDMFYRGIEISQGAGLGLYITREMVTRLKGKIEIDSLSGMGTIVTIAIPNTLPL